MITMMVNNTKKPVPRAFLEKWLLVVERQLIKKKAATKKALDKELVIVFMPEDQAKSLNSEFRGKAYATDVLSFDSIEPDSLGELVLCPEVITRQAIENKHSYRDECAYLILHGILHLLGYEHETNDRDAQKMYAVQDKIFEFVSTI